MNNPTARSFDNAFITGRSIKSHKTSFFLKKLFSFSPFFPFFFVFLDFFCCLLREACFKCTLNSKPFPGDGSNNKSNLNICKITNQITNQIQGNIRSNPVFVLKYKLE